MLKKTFYILTLLLSLQLSSQSFVRFSSLSPDFELVDNSFDNAGKSLIYPNPAKDFTFVKSKSSFLGIKSIMIYTVVGNEVLNLRANNANKVRVNLSRIRSGKYLIKVVFTDDSEEAQILVKQ